MRSGQQYRCMTVNAAQTAAAAVRAEAARAGLSLRGLAAQLGWEDSYLQRRTSGRVPFRVDELDAIASALNIPLARLIEQPVNGDRGVA
jgi:transcriptional regulator with XRE-family HTH domain